MGCEFKVGDFVVFIQDSHGIKKGTIGRIRRIFNGQIAVDTYHNSRTCHVTTTTWYRTNHRVPFQLSRKEDQNGQV